MNLNKVTCLAILIVVLTSGCAAHRHSVYQSWAKQLSEAGITIRTVDDVSFLLGSPPTRCDSIEPTPLIGVRLKIDATIFWVDPNGAAAAAGMQAGERILRINEVLVNNGNEAINALRTNLRNDYPVTVETTARIYTMKPKMPTEAKQCYWDITAGAVAQSSGGAYVNEYGGSAGHHGSAYQRFFRASCRIYDGVVLNCQANWQE